MYTLDDSQSVSKKLKFDTSGDSSCDTYTREVLNDSNSSDKLSDGLLNEGHLLESVPEQVSGRGQDINCFCVVAIAEG